MVAAGGLARLSASVSLRTGVVLALARLAPQQVTARLRDAHSIEQLVQLHSEHGASFNRFHFGAFWGGVKRLAPRERRWVLANREALRPACEQTARMLPELGPREVASTAHALAKARLHRGTPWEMVWEPLPMAASAGLREMKPQELANTAWAFATVGHSEPSLFDELAGVAGAQLDDFNSQALANTAWAYATAGHASRELFDAIALESASRLDEFNSQEIANLAWAYATAGHASPALFDALAAEAVLQLESFRAQELTNLVWAFASLGHPAPHLFAQLATQASAMLGRFTPQALANTAWAFATAGESAPALFDAIAIETAERGRDLASFQPQNLANLVWAFGQVEHVDMCKLFTCKHAGTRAHTGEASLATTDVRRGAKHGRSLAVGRGRGAPEEPPGLLPVAAARHAAGASAARGLRGERPVGPRGGRARPRASRRAPGTCRGRAARCSAQRHAGPHDRRAHGRQPVLRPAVLLR